MRAWTIVLFILAVHACLAMFNMTSITDSGVGITIDTSQKNGFVVTPGGYNATLPSSDPRFFNESASNGQGNATMLTKNDFIGEFIESIVGAGAMFSKLITSFGDAVFSIHTLCAPYFGNFNAWILEGMVDFMLGIAFFQMVTGRSFKTME